MTQPELTQTGQRMRNIVDQVNSNNSSWKAQYNPIWDDVDASHFKKHLMDISFVKREHKTKPKTYATQGYTYPASFDSREAWPDCTSIKEIRDQSDCGSCWAVSSGSAMSDRVCIESGQTDQTRISETDILSCCYECGYGCNGGQEDEAFAHWISTGFVTGGNYDDHTYCRAYSFPRCAHHVVVAGMSPCGGAEYETPDCVNQCDSGTNLNYNDQIRKGASYHTFHNAEDIAQEISNHGPVVTGFTVYEDFMAYTSGIYQYVTGEELGGHAVRIIGYGSEGGLDYWLATNSWNEHWGEDGTFRFKKGDDCCGFEDDVVSGHSVESPHSHGLNL